MPPQPIPKYIDDPPRILLWRSDDFLPLAIGMLAGVLANQFLICMAIAFVSVRFWRRHRDNRPDGYVLHLMYWWGAMQLKCRSPNAYCRSFAP